MVDVNAKQKLLSPLGAKVYLSMYNTAKFIIFREKPLYDETRILLSWPKVSNLDRAYQILTNRKKELRTAAQWKHNCRSRDKERNIIGRKWENPGNKPIAS